MRILIYGAGKTGTTAVFYAYKNAIPGIAVAFEPASLQKLDFAASPDLLVKTLTVMKHAREQAQFKYFDKKILIVRHPFDRLVSYALYAPNNGGGFFDDRKMEEYLALLRRKLAAPQSVPFRAIVDFASEQQPTDVGIHAPVKTLQTIADTYPDFFLLRYEDFVDGKLDALNAYTGVPISSDPQIPGSEQKVIRSKSYGDWHKWFLPEDVAHFQGVYESYLKRFGYDVDLDRGAAPLSEDTTIAYSIKVANQGRRVRWLPQFVPGKVSMKGEGRSYQIAKRALMEGRVERAEEIVDGVLASNSSIAGFYELRGRISMQRNDYATAAEALKQAIRLLPDEPKFHQQLGRALRKAGKAEESQAALKAAKGLHAESAV